MDGLPTPKKQRPWLRRLVILQASITVLLLATIVVSVVIDRQDQKWVTCGVISAEGRMVGGGGLRGSSGSVSAVVVETENCSQVIVKRGVSSQNMDEVASFFENGNLYDFKMGPVSRKLAELPWVPTSPSATDYRESSPEESLSSP